MEGERLEDFDHVFDVDDVSWRRFELVVGVAHMSMHALSAEKKVTQTQKTVPMKCHQCSTCDQNLHSLPLFIFHACKGIQASSERAWFNITYILPNAYIHDLLRR